MKRNLQVLLLLCFLGMTTYKVSAESRVNGNLNTNDDITINGNLDMDDNAQLQMGGIKLRDSEINGDVNIESDIAIGGDIELEERSQLSVGSLKVSGGGIGGAATVQSSVQLQGEVSGGKESEIAIGGVQLMHGANRNLISDEISPAKRIASPMPVVERLPIVGSQSRSGLPKLGLTSVPLKIDPLSKKKKGSTSIELKGKYAQGETSVVEFGGKNNNVKLLNAKGSARYGIKYNLNDSKLQANIIDLSGEMSVVEAKVGTVDNPILGAEGEVKMLAAGGKARFGINMDEKEVSAGLDVGASAVVASASGRSYISFMPKPIYDNTLGALLGKCSWTKDYAKFPDFLNHGPVIGIGGEVGVGAKAKATVGVVGNENMIGVEAGGSFGVGGFGGVKFSVGVR